MAAVQKKLGESVPVVSAFQNISAHHLDEEMDCGVLVCANDPARRQCRGRTRPRDRPTRLDAGLLANSAVAEGPTSILITFNRRYQVSGSDTPITGI